MLNNSKIYTLFVGYLNNVFLAKITQFLCTMLQGHIKYSLCKQINCLYTCIGRYTIYVEQEI